jgi:hypothetical protein
VVCVTASSFSSFLDVFSFFLQQPPDFFFIMSRREGDRERERASRAQQQQASARTNEYFVPKEGIDREVITADICRYLGNDALVRPGNYEVSFESEDIESAEEMADSPSCRIRRRDKSSKATLSPHTEISQP